MLTPTRSLCFAIGWILSKGHWHLISCCLLVGWFCCCFHGNIIFFLLGDGGYVAFRGKGRGAPEKIQQLCKTWKIKNWTLRWTFSWFCLLLQTTGKVAACITSAHVIKGIFKNISVGNFCKSFCYGFTCLCFAKKNNIMFLSWALHTFITFSISCRAKQPSTPKPVFQNFLSVTFLVTSGMNWSRGKLALINTKFSTGLNNAEKIIQISPHAITHCTAISKCKIHVFEVGFKYLLYF